MSQRKPIPVILDGDPGHDDAIAWVLASTVRDFDIKAITTVAGNQTLEKVTYNVVANTPTPNNA
ncbi:MAG: nucleoside hydrolase [Erysipelotrichaceae bacterium]|nr:nucleoside hydrolase [Erysipelotrichaceae bacterium]